MPSPRSTSHRSLGILILASLCVGLLLGPAARAGTNGFASLMAAAMDRMDRAMGVAPSGDADRDFAAMMIPHHQGAIDVARAELGYGRDQVLRRLAEGIVVEQQQEIAVMRQALAALPPARPAAAASPIPPTMTMPGTMPAIKDR